MNYSLSTIIAITEYYKIMQHYMKSEKTFNDNRID